MSVLIKQATIVSKGSPLNGKRKDILIQNGIITSIADSIKPSTERIIEEEGLHISIGWMDSFAQFGDPGFEYRETIESGTKAAASGGFTEILITPNTNPVVSTKSQVEYIIQKKTTAGVKVYPIGAITKNAAGKELAEMYDMANSGAIAFSDGLNCIQDGSLLLKALQYVKTIDGTVIQLPDDKTIGTNGLINEGIISTQLGLPGKPAMAEEIMVARDIELTNYAASKLHFTGISSSKSLEHIKQAKSAGIKISCSVTPYHLFFSDDDLQQYDTNLKVNPPIRTKKDRQDLIEGLLDGTIDFIASHHLPQNYDAKVCEFEYAKNGMIGLESLFGAVWSVVKQKWSIEELIDRFSVSPRKTFGLSIPEMKEGEIANLTLFNPTSSYTFGLNNIHSNCSNSAFIGKELVGKVVGIINGPHIHIN
jgi:dihydroorotase